MIVLTSTATNRAQVALAVQPPRAQAIVLQEGFDYILGHALHDAQRRHSKGPQSQVRQLCARGVPVPGYYELCISCLNANTRC